MKTLLDIPEGDYDQLSVANPVLKKFFRDKKSVVVDLKLTTKSGRIIHVELQVEKKSNLKNRIVYYLTRLISDQMNWGDDYDMLKEVISIVICDHNLLEEEKSYINEYKLRNDQNNSFTQLLKLIILELPKVPESDDKSALPWLQFLKCKKMEEYDMLALKYPELEKPIFCAKKMSLSERWRDYWLHKNLAKWDEVNRLRQVKIDAREEGLAEGRAQGVAEGRAEEKLLLEKNALLKGLSMETIISITGLDEDSIRQINTSHIS